MIEQAMFTYPPLGKAFKNKEKQSETKEKSKVSLSKI